MLSLQVLREQPELVRRSIARRHTPQPLDETLAVDAELRTLQRQYDEARSEQREQGKRVGAAHDAEEKQRLLAGSGVLSDRVKELEGRVRELTERRDALLLEFTNIPDDSVPDGADERENVVVKQDREPADLSFTPLPHWELGERLGILNFAHGTKIAGSRFYVLQRQGAQLQRALIAFMLDLHRRQGYAEQYLPFLIREAGLLAAGQLPKFRDNLYRDVEDDLWLVPTAEVPLTAIYAGEILDGRELPLDLVAYTPCFRREKMSAGRDVRGIKRGHQFDKVEMYMLTRPEDSDAALDKLVADAEQTCALLGLTYRRVQLCGGDLGFAAAVTFDIEVWAPGCDEWLEVSSCSNVRDFQARRANIRFRREPGVRPEFVHTLNGSGLGLPRTLIAVLETYQQADGSVHVPEVLLPWMGGTAVIGP